MNRTELIGRIASDADISKAEAGRALESVTEAIKRTLKKGDTVQIVGFGTFSAKKLPARTGLNPRTGEAINIAAKRTPKFVPGQTLKDALN